MTTPLNQILYAFLPCTLLLQIVKTPAITSALYIARDSVSVSINAVNLSEDMSTLSSKNDELLLLIYTFDDTTKLNQPILTAYFVLDSAQRKNTTTHTVSEGVNNLLLILAELDTDRTPDVAEKMIRKNFRSIMGCIERKDLIALQKYVGDDDIIGIKKLTKADRTKGINFSFQGRYKLDKFLYRIELKAL